MANKQWVRVRREGGNKREEKQDFLFFKEQTQPLFCLRGRKTSGCPLQFHYLPVGGALILPHPLQAQASCPSFLGAGVHTSTPALVGMVPGLLPLGLTPCPCWDGPEIPQTGQSLSHLHPVPTRALLWLAAGEGSLWVTQTQHTPAQASPQPQSPAGCTFCTWALRPIEDQAGDQL